MVSKLRSGALLDYISLMIVAEAKGPVERDGALGAKLAVEQPEQNARAVARFEVALLYPSLRRWGPWCGGGGEGDGGAGVSFWSGSRRR
jgi:hypothetical protein